MPDDLHSSDRKADSIPPAAPLPIPNMRALPVTSKASNTFENSRAFYSEATSVRREPRGVNHQPDAGTDVSQHASGPVLSLHSKHASGVAPRTAAAETTSV